MIIFLYGDDDYQSTQKLSAIKEKFAKRDAFGLGLSVLDYDEREGKASLSEVVGAGGLFSSKKLVIVRSVFNFGSSSDQENILEFLKVKKNLPEDREVTIVFWEKGSPRKNNKLFKFLIQKSKNREFEKLEGGNLSGWAEEKVEQLRAGISPEAVQRLVAYVGNDLWRMENEIGKLANFKGGEIIEANDVDLLVKSKTEADIFKTVEALGAGDKKTALGFLHNQLEKGDDPFYILSMYIYQFRNLLKIGSYYYQGITDQYEIAKDAKIHPFVVGKGIAQLRGFSQEKLKKIYGKLSRIDIDVKTGAIDIGLALDKFVMEM